MIGPAKTKQDRLEEIAALERKIQELEKSSPISVQTHEITQESDRRFRLLIEAANDWIWEINKDRLYTYASPKIKDLLGYEPADVIGKTPFDFMPKEEARRVAALFKPIEETRRSFSGLENKNIHEDGHEIVIETSGVPILDDQGNFLGYCGFDRDVTERKWAEEQLRQSEEKYRSILENIEEGYYEVDLNGNCVFLNDSVSRIYGYSKEELLGTSYTLYSDEDSAKKSYQAFHDVYKTGKKRSDYECEIIRKDGTRRYIQGSVSLMKDSAGQPSGFQGIIRDVTDQKRTEKALRESEKLYRTALEKSNDGVVIIRDSRYVYFNQEFLDKIGRTGDEMMGKVIGAYIHSDDRAAVMDHLNKYKQGLPTPKHIETRLLKPDGTIFYVEISLAEVIYQGDKAVLGYLRDITERKRAEEERYRYEKIHGVLEMAGAICHELNQPMQIISGYSEMILMNTQENDPIHVKAEKINKQIRRIGSITKKLMRIHDCETEDYAGFSRIINIHQEPDKDAD